MLAGNVAALLSPVVFSVILTFTFGSQKYDYESMRAIRKVDDRDVAAAAHVDIELIPGEDADPTNPDPNHPGAVGIGGAKEEEEEEEGNALNRASLYARCLCVFMVLCFLILWPIPMYGTGYVFSRQFFTGWAVVGIIWMFFTAFGVILFPLYEGRDTIWRTVRLMTFDIVGRRGAQEKGVIAQGGEYENENEGSDTTATKDKNILGSDSVSPMEEQVYGGESKGVAEVDKAVS